MSVAVRLGGVALAFLVASVGCDSAFRFDQPAVPGDGGPADGAEGGSTDAGGQRTCTDDTTCGPLHCQLATAACVACVADTNCSGARPKCDTAAGVCVECNTTDDCSARQTCNPRTGRCLDTCVDSDDPCPLAGFVCEGKLKLCVECEESEHCTSADRRVCDVPIGRCVECTGNARCPSSRPVCDRRTGRCEACVTSAECDLGSVCDPVTLTCLQLP